jgi:hypothetical protein
MYVTHPFLSHMLEANMHNVASFVDQDMFMQYGGGVGHTYMWVIEQWLWETGWSQGTPNTGGSEPQGEGQPQQEESEDESNSETRSDSDSTHELDQEDDEEVEMVENELE